MNDWAFYVASTSGDIIGELDGATGRKVTFKLDGPPEASWNIDGHHQAAAVLGELTTDLYVRWGNRTMTRLRVGSSSDDIGADAHTTSWGAVGYAGLLERRYTFAPLTWTAQDLSFIAWDLIAYTQNDTRTGYAGGQLGIARGVHPDFGDINYTVPAGKKIAEAIGDLSHLAFGLAFDWEISADLEFNIWAARGIARDFVAEYRSNVVAVRRQVDTSTYANTVRASGADGVAASAAAAADLSSRLEGRIEAQIGNTDLTTPAAVAGTAASELANLGAITPTYTMTMAPGRWNPDLLWLGDVATFVIRSGRLQVVAQDRVVQIDVTIGDDGGETVDITFGIRRQTLAAFLRKIPARLEALARR